MMAIVASINKKKAAKYHNPFTKLNPDNTIVAFDAKPSHGAAFATPFADVFPSASLALNAFSIHVFASGLQKVVHGIIDYAHSLLLLARVLAMRFLWVEE